jgi:V/A-type H+-transporting ATPase subunit D
MLHPSRTNLLLLRDRATAVDGGVTLLKGRRQALLREFLQASAPLLASRRKLACLYAEGVATLHRAQAAEGESYLAGVARGAARDLGLTSEERNLLGLRYREVRAAENPCRAPWQREYDERATAPELEEALERVEKMVAAMLEQAVVEGKVKRLGEELLRLTRRIRVLEERLLPQLRTEARLMERFLSEREREAFFGLKRYKEKRMGEGIRPAAG